MRIAFFGGTFDPPHRGHVAVAGAAIDRLQIDRVLFAPVGRQPLKGETAPSAYADRCRMVELAIAGNPKLVLSHLDAPQRDGRPNYTIGTLARLKSAFAEGDELFCLLGADSFLTLPQWHRAAELLAASNFIVASRPGFNLDDLASAIPAGLSPPRLVDRGPGYEAYRTGSSETQAIYLLPSLDYDISATRIRAALAEGSAAGDLLAPAVVDYIEAHGLYRDKT